MQGKRTMIALECAHCGESFQAVKALIDYARKKRGRVRFFCSKACNAAHKSGEMRECVNCGVAFYRYPSQTSAPGRTNRYCSLRCRGIAQRTYMKGQQHTPERKEALSKARSGREFPHLRKPPMTWQCWHCGWVRELVGQERGRALRTGRRFCSYDCYCDFIRCFPEEAPGYIGGTFALYGRNWKRQADLARERDGHTCRDCGRHQTSPLLPVHHVTARRHFGTDWEAANRLDNLVTLCESCHTRREATLRVAIRRLRKLGVRLSS